MVWLKFASQQAVTMLKNFLSENFRLKTDQLFGSLTAEELESLMGSGVTHVYKKGEIISRLQFLLIIGS